MNKAHEHRPDLVILDVNMPGGGGGDVYDLLSMSSQTSDTPVFFISGTDFEDLRSDFSFIKRAQFFSKPIDEALLLERVRHLFSSGI
jgi:DNA-binding response OmpR family regulator